MIILAVDLNLADIAIANNGPITAAELAEKSKADIRLISKLCSIKKNHKVSLTNMLKTEFSRCSYPKSSPQHQTLHNATPKLPSAVPYQRALPSAAPSFTSTTTSVRPSSSPLLRRKRDSRDNLFCFAYGCKGETYFDFMNKPENVKMFDAFNETMTLVKPGERNKFVQWYPVKERLAITEPSCPLFVDVGGGVGHQVVKFCERAEGLPGEPMLLDLPSVIAQAKGLPNGVVTVGHSFFDPFLPVVKGAKAFYLCMLLHDWPEMQALTILTNIVNSMAEDSVVLIHEVILPETETEVVHFYAKIDWQMMNLGSSERTKAQWKDLFGKVGLEIRGLWWEEEVTKGKKALMELGLMK